MLDIPTYNHPVLTEREKIKKTVAEYCRSENPLPARDHPDREKSLRTRIAYYIGLLKADWPYPLNETDWQIAVMNGVTAHE